MKIREIITEEMHDQDMNPGQLARAAGMSRSAVYDYIAGRADLTSRYIDRLFEVLGLEVIPKEF